MAHRATPQAPKSDAGATLSRRRFLQGGLAAAAAASAALALPAGGEAAPAAATVQPAPREQPAKPVRGKGPNILIILCDQMRFPPSYESDLTKQFREAHLEFQNKLLAEGLDFKRHYIMSTACVPSRASMLTGHYPSLHGTSQTVGTAKEDFEPDMFWLDPNSVPTVGSYLRAAGYLTFWIGKWHVSASNMMIPGTHEPLPSFDPETGARDPAKEKLYQAANRLNPFGFVGWIGPEAHGADYIKDSGSSVPDGYRGRDISFAEQATELIQELDRHPSSTPWLVVCSFVNPHDIGAYGMFTRLAGWNFAIDEDLDPPVPQAGDLFTSSFNESRDDPLTDKPKAQVAFRDLYHVWLNPVLDNETYSRFYYQLHKNVDQEMMKVFTALQNSRYADDTIVIFTADHGEMLLAHGGMHNKMYQAYDETTRVPLMIWYPKLIPGPRSVDALTSHADFAPTLLRLAGIDAGRQEEIRQMLAVNHSDALPFVGRDLSSLILGEADPASVNAPVYYMTEDDPTRGLHMNRRIGVGYIPITEPAHVETVIARLSDGHLWKFSRYFDNPQYWTSPGNPAVPKDEDLDVLRVEKEEVLDVLRVEMEADPKHSMLLQKEVLPCLLGAKA
jgi:choline-sulfatase